MPQKQQGHVSNALHSHAAQHNSINISSVSYGIYISLQCTVSELCKPQSNDPSTQYEQQSPLTIKRLKTFRSIVSVCCLVYEYYRTRTYISYSYFPSHPNIFIFYSHCFYIYFVELSRFLVFLSCFTNDTKKKDNNSVKLFACLIGWLNDFHVYF